MFKILIKYILANALLAFGLIVSAQPQSNSEIDKFSSLSFGMDYMGDYNVNGRVNTQASQPNLTSMASYFHKSGFDISFMYTNIWNSDETYTQATQETDLSLGYSAEITNWLNGMASYSHFIYSDNSNSFRSNYKHLVSASLFSEVNWWLADVTVGYYSGRSNELFSSFETGVLFEFDDFLKKDNSLSIEPMVMINMGDIGYYDAQAYTDYRFAYGFAKSFPQLTAGEFLSIIDNPQTYREKNISDRLQNQPDKIDKLRELSDDTVLWNMFEEKSTFNLNNIGFTIPIYYYWSDFMINIGFSAFKPINQPSYVEEEWSSYANFGLTYFMSW
ncbi:hypothetical protein [Labilibacter marinus]|uniref:hypothetical protein n=1 Tax=Labilibacter marinus TaxID=1477105 RepID=UPI00117B1652|nr:hypothetical protein [Labilibacter marinus]